MTIDWNNFTPWASLAGGILLGAASALFILLNRPRYSCWPCWQA